VLNPPTWHSWTDNEEKQLLGVLVLEEDVRCLNAEPSECIRGRTMRKYFPLAPSASAVPSKPGTAWGYGEYPFSVSVEEELPGTMLYASSATLHVSITYDLQVQRPAFLLLCPCE